MPPSGLGSQPPVWSTSAQSRRASHAWTKARSYPTPGTYNSPRFLQTIWVELGASCTLCLCFLHSRITLDFGGDDITEYLFYLLKGINWPYRECELNRMYDWGLMTKLKKMICSLAEVSSIPAFSFPTSRLFVRIVEIYLSCCRPTLRLICTISMYADRDILPNGTQCKYTTSPCSRLWCVTPIPSNAPTGVNLADHIVHIRAPHNRFRR